MVDIPFDVCAVQGKANSDQYFYATSLLPFYNGFVLTLKVVQLVQQKYLQIRISFVYTHKNMLTFLGAVQKLCFFSRGGGGSAKI